MWIVCITSVRHVLTVNGYGGRQTKENEKSWCFKGWETLVIEIYNECNLKDSRVIIQANLDLLQILKAYDELKQLGHLEKSKHTIKAAQSLSKWLLENERENSMIALHQLNSLQITKRQRAFTEDEINLLLQLSQNNSDMVRAGAFLLLGKIDVAQFIIQQFPEDEKTRFMEFPIAIFIKGTNC